MTDRDPPADDPATDATTDARDGSTEQGTHSAAAPEEPDRSGRSSHAGDPDRDRDRRRTDDGGGISDAVALAISLLFGFALAIGAILLVSWLDPGFEGLLRVRPTVAGGGVGAGWTAGNAGFWLNLMITLVHLADVVMGVFILLMVFVHWAAFRRLAARMQPPGGRPSDRRTPATDGGEREAATDAPPAETPDARAEEGGDRG